MRNRNNDLLSGYGNFFKALGLGFLLLLLKYIAIALGTIGLIVAIFYWIKGYFRE